MTATASVVTPHSFLEKLDIFPERCFPNKFRISFYRGQILGWCEFSGLQKPTPETNSSNFHLKKNPYVCFREGNPPTKKMVIKHMSDVYFKCQGGEI